MRLILKQTMAPDLSGFVIDRVFPGRDNILLADYSGPELARTDLQGKVIERCRLPNAQRIDSMLVLGNELAVCAGVNHKLLVYSFGEPGQAITLRLARDLPLGSRIVSMALLGNQFLLLDKSYCQLRIWDRDWREMRVLGSRHGYLKLAEERLGMEFPEDLLVDGRECWLADSGNRRVLRLDGGLENSVAFELPEHPVRLLMADRENVYLADYYNRVMVLSRRYGYLGSLDSPDGIDLQTAGSVEKLVWATAESDKLAAISLPVIDVEQALREQAKPGKLARFLLDQGREAETWPLLEQSAWPLPELGIFVGRPGEEKLNSFLSAALENIRQTIARLRSEIMELAAGLYAFYQNLPLASEPEEMSPQRHMQALRLVEKIAELRGQYREINDGKSELPSASEPGKTLRGFLAGRRDALLQEIAVSEQQIAKLLVRFQSGEMARSLSYYWLLREELELLFAGDSAERENLLAGRHLNQVLGSFYYQVALFYQRRGDWDNCREFLNKEVGLYPKRVSVFLHYIDLLLEKGDYENALEMLEKIRDKETEGVNFKFFQVYSALGEKEKAGRHLSREWELFPNRLDILFHLAGQEELDDRHFDELTAEIMNRPGLAIDLRLNVARAFKARGRLKEAAIWLESELAAFPENRQAEMLKLEMLLAQAGDREEIKRLADRLSGDQPGLNLLRARAFFALEDREKGLLFLHREREAYPRRLDYLPVLVKNTETEENWSAEILADLPGHPGLRINLCLQVAQAFWGKRLLKEAEAWLDQEIESFPENPRAEAFKLELLLACNGNRQEIAVLAERIKGRHAGAELLRARAFAVVGSKNAAWQAYQRYLLIQQEQTAHCPEMLDLLNEIELTVPEMHELSDELKKISDEQIRLELELYFELGQDKPPKAPAVYLASRFRPLAEKHFLKRARDLWNQGETTACLDLLEEILHFNPGHQQVMVLLDEIEAFLQSTSP